MPDVRRHPVALGATAALADHLGSLLGPGVVTSGRLCPACGSDQHGAPWARLDGRAFAVSVSRSGSHLVTAIGTHGRVGVDIESIDAVARGWDPGMVLAEGETADTAEEQAWHWAAKEAVLKAMGVGLARPMTSVALADHDVRRVPSPNGYVTAATQLS